MISSEKALWAVCRDLLTLIDSINATYSGHRVPTHGRCSCHGRKEDGHYLHLQLVRVGLGKDHSISLISDVFNDLFRIKSGCE